MAHTDEIKLTKEEIAELKNGNSIVVQYQSPVDIMIGQYDDMTLLIIPPKEDN